MNKAIIITNMETAEEAYQKMFQEYAGEPLDNPVGVLYRNRKAWNAYERGNSL